jgi:hypothetical protein
VEIKKLAAASSIGSHCSSDRSDAGGKPCPDGQGDRYPKKTRLPAQLWPLVVTNSVNTRPLTVGLAIFGAPESGVDWSVISAGTLIAVAPLLVAFLLFQRQFMQSFMQAGIK